MVSYLPRWSLYASVALLAPVKKAPAQPLVFIASFPSCGISAWFTITSAADSFGSAALIVSKSDPVARRAWFYWSS